jgi:hypothetical protein
VLVTIKLPFGKFMVTLKRNVAIAFYQKATAEIGLPEPGVLLDELVCRGARQIIQQAIEPI